MRLTIKTAKLDIKHGTIFKFYEIFYMIVQDVNEDGWRLLALDGLVLQSDVYNSLESIISDYNITKTYESELIVNV